MFKVLVYVMLIHLLRRVYSKTKKYQIYYLFGYFFETNYFNQVNIEINTYRTRPPPRPLDE